MGARGTGRTWRAGLAALALACALAAGLAGCARDEGAAPGRPTAPAPLEVEVRDPSASQEAPAAQATDTLAGLLRAREVGSVRVLGDSLTAGYLLEGHDAPSDTGELAYVGGEGTYYETPTTVANWANAFRSYATAQGVGRFVNAAVSGFRMQYLAEEPDAWLGEGADVIVVMLGTNDAAKESVEDFAAYAEQALTAAEARCRHLVVVSPPRNERTDAYNLYGMERVDEVLARLCAAHGWEHVSLLDVLEVGTDDFFADQVHPTEQGSAKLWEAFRTRLALP